jgi:hypothetical protein
VSRLTLAIYLLAPIGIVLWAIATLIGGGNASIGDFFAVPVQVLVFYPGPYLWWVGLCKFNSWRARYWHAGLIAASCALATCLVAPYFGRDPSGLPYHWFFYWPLAALLQIVFAVGLRVVSGFANTRTPNTSFERTREG